MSTLARLNVLLGADTSDLESALAGVSQKVQNAGKSITEIGGTLSKNLTAPIAAAGAAALAAAVKVGNMADTLLDLEQQTGLSTNSLQEYRRVATVAGVAQDTIADSAIRLGTRLKAVGAESDGVQATLGRLGLSARDANGGLRSMDDVLPEIITSLQGMEDITERNSLATELFGRGAASLAPILGMTADEMAHARSEAHSLGMVLGKDALTSANDFRIEWDTMRAQFGAAVAEIGIAVIPIMQQFVGLINQHVVPAVRSVIGWLGDMDPTTQKVIAVVAGLAAAIGPLLVAMGTAITLGGKVMLALSAINPVVLAVTAAIAAGILVWQKWGAEISLFVRAALTVIQDRLTSLANAMRPWADAIRAGLSAVVSGLKWWYTNAVKPIQDFVLLAGEWLVDKLGGVLGHVMDAVAALVGFFAPNMAEAARSVSRMVGDISAEMRRLRTNMDRDARSAAESVTLNMAAMSDDVIELVEDMSTGVVRSVGGMRAASVAETELMTGEIVREFRTMDTELRTIVPQTVDGVVGEYRRAEVEVGQSVGATATRVTSIFDDLATLLPGKAGQTVTDIGGKWGAIQGILESPLLGDSGALGRIFSAWDKWGSDIIGTLTGVIDKIKAFGKVAEAMPGPGGVGGGGGLDLGGVPGIGQVIQIAASVGGDVAIIRALRQGLQAVNEQIAHTAAYMANFQAGRLDPMLQKLQEIALSNLNILAEAFNAAMHLSHIRDGMSQLATGVATFGDAELSFDVLPIVQSIEQMEASFVDAIGRGTDRVVSALGAFDPSDLFTQPSEGPFATTPINQPSGGGTGGVTVQVFQSFPDGAAATASQIRAATYEGVDEALGNRSLRAIRLAGGTVR